MNLLGTAFLAFLFSVSAQAEKLDTQGIYGNDDRSEVCDQRDSNIRALGESTLASIPKNEIASENEFSYTLKKSIYGEKLNLCKSEAFYSQPMAANCSGFLVGEDLMVTAGHCITKSSCGKDFWVFNYQMSSHGDSPWVLQKDDVYKCAQVIDRQQTATIDYALIKLDRKVKNGRAVVLRKSAEPKVGDDLFVIGYPEGLPAKVATNAKVRKWEPQKRFFVANLDTYGGNSGSPVFNAKTLEVEGILVRGDVDFVQDGACQVSRKCSDEACDGEEVTNISFVQKTLNN